MKAMGHASFDTVLLPKSLIIDLTHTHPFFFLSPSISAIWKQDCLFSPWMQASSCQPSSNQIIQHRTCCLSKEIICHPNSSRAYEYTRHQGTLQGSGRYFVAVRVMHIYIPFPVFFSLTSPYGLM